MCGGNPRNDAFGFRYWSHPGAWAEHLSQGRVGRFEGFLACLQSACFCIVGPEYCSIAAAQTKRPRVYVKNAFKMIYWRLGVFFILGALSVGILIPYNDPRLVEVLQAGIGSGTASASLYVIAMQNLGVDGLPHFINALLVTSIFSAGNAYSYCATRSLYGLAFGGRTPSIFRYCTGQGMPVFCFCFVVVFSCLAFLQLGTDSAKVLSWFLNLTTAGGLINYIVMSLTFIQFFKACRVQGVDRHTLPYTGWFQPNCAYIGLIAMIVVVLCYGYTSFRPWSFERFFTFYAMLILAPVLYIFWQIFKRSKVVDPAQADLLWERVIIDVYESPFIDPPVGFWGEMLQLVSLTHLRSDTRTNMS